MAGNDNAAVIWGVRRVPHHPLCQVWARPCKAVQNPTLVYARGLIRKSCSYRAGTAKACAKGFNSARGAPLHRNRIGQGHE